MKNEPLSKDVVLALCELKIITDFHTLAELYNECVIAKLRLPQHHINITISYFLNNICVLIILCVYNKCKNKTEFAPTEKHQLFM